MKLIRLATNDNGYFRSAFGNDMILQPYSKIALLNLTFKSDIGKIPGMEIIGDSNIILLGEVGNAASGRTVTLDPDDFNDGDFERFRQTVELYLNSSPSITYGSTEADQANTSGSAFSLEAGSDGNMVIGYNYAPFVNPLLIVFGGAVKNTIMDFDPVITKVDHAGGGPFGEATTISKDLTQVATIDRANNLLASVPLAKGASWFQARVSNLVTNGSLNQDNGFGIGLSKVDLSTVNIQPGDDIPAAYRYAEIRVNRPAENYVYIVDGGLEITSPVTPEHVAFLTTGNVNKHDIMGFEINGGEIDLCIYQDQSAGRGGGYIDLTTGNNWIQTGTGTQEIYSENDLGDIATYKRSQVGTPGLEQWWEAVGTTNWNIYNNKPVAGSVVDATAVYATNVLTITGSGGGTATFTATGTPTIKPPSQLGLRTVLATIPINPGEEFYPYIYIRGDQLNCQIDLANYVAKDVEIAGNRLSQIRDNGAYLNRYDQMLGNVANNIHKVVPNVDSGPVSDLGFQGRWVSRVDFQLTIPQNILSALGFSRFNPFSQVGHLFEQTIGGSASSTRFLEFSEIADTLPEEYISDNFLVESMSLPLDSFDASQVEYRTGTLFNDNVSKSGRRKNILMTIPENDNDSGLVEFETSTPIFIDVNNAEKLNIKNLDFRILRNDFSPINQATEQAIMTILIDSAK